MTDNPRLMEENEAQAYLGGINPRCVMPPVRLGGRLRWDRVALNQKLDEIFGVVHPEEPSKESALEKWRRGKGGGQDAA